MYVVIEGVSEVTAGGLADAWSARLPPLAVVSRNAARFGSQALGTRTATELRNHGSVCLVLCQGQHIADAQSIRAFHNVAPGVLLDSLENLLLLAQVAPSAPLDGPARHVRSALTSVQSAARPSAAAVADYFDALAAGADPLERLPLIGGFADTASTSLTAERVIDNLRLAATRRSEEVRRPEMLLDIRRRAQSLYEEKGLDRSSARLRVGRLMELLQNGSDALLSELTYDEAREVLEARRARLAEAAERDVDRYSRASDADLPWDQYRDHARALDRPDDRREAAGELLRLDDTEQRQILQRETRRRLEALLRDRALDGSRPSFPEGAIARAAAALGERLTRIEVTGPDSSTRSHSRTSALRDLTLACARLRLRPLLVRLQNERGIDIDGELLLAPGDDISDETFTDAQLGPDGSLPDLQLRIRGTRRSVAVSWRPDFDDVMCLRFCLLLSELPALTLTSRSPMSLHGFVAGEPCEPTPVPADLLPLARKLHGTATVAMATGLTPEALDAWPSAWRAAVDGEQESGSRAHLDALALTGALVAEDGTAALGPLAPLKAEWIAAFGGASREILDGVLDALDAGEGGDPELESTTRGLGAATAAHYPPYLHTSARDRAQLPSSEGRVWSVYGGPDGAADSYGDLALTSVMRRLLELQPDAAGHLRCLSLGPGAANLLATQATGLVGTRVGRATVGVVELFCVGSRPDDDVLDRAAEKLGPSSSRLLLRYLDTLADAERLLKPAGDTEAVHLALVTGITSGGDRLLVEPAEVPPPPASEDVLFTPRTWLRPGKDRRTLLMPPTASATMLRWLRLANAVDEDWPEPSDDLRVPEIRTGSMEVASDLAAVHRLALWVASLDRYATRDSLEQALGEDVAILHQERRLGTDSPLSLVISQRSGGPADRAISRSLLSAGIVRDADVASDLGLRLRQTASQGYGILALEAATTGAGINELVGHVVAFSLLAERSTPWPLPPGCRVLLVSLDDYGRWFPGKRADLLALALDTGEGGLHGAVIEIKARRSSETVAAKQALDQVRQSLAATREAARPRQGSVPARLWLNRIAEAAYAVARESRFRLTREEILAIEDFRKRGSLEWAGLGLVFGPANQNDVVHYHYSLGDDKIPIVIHTVELTQGLLERATDTKLTELRTAEAERAPLEGGRRRRRPESKTASADDTPPPGPPQVEDKDLEPTEVPGSARTRDDDPSGKLASDDTSEHVAPVPPAEPSLDTGAKAAVVFDPPVLGWYLADGTPLRWHAAGSDSPLNNGHIEIWGSSGAGKTEFTKSLLAQLANSSGSRFGIADFKNDYGGSFPDAVGAEFLDLWNEGAPYNPLALADASERTITKTVIELRDTVEVAVQSFARMGHRQVDKLRIALEEAYSVGRSQGRWPTLLTLNDCLDADLQGIIGDLTRTNLFRDGPPLGDVTEENVVFGLSNIPGNGQTTVLAAGFILSALLLKMQGLPPVPNTIRYIAVVDEAHRVAAFKAVSTMIREGRSKGLAVLLATQQPGDLPEVVSANAETKVCFRLPDATVATAAAKKLNPRDSTLPEQIRTLATGEAFVSLGGKAPVLIQTAQFWRDRARLRLPE